jgi:hypothetical protein
MTRAWSSESKYKYSPLEPFVTQEWRPSEVELVK